MSNSISILTVYIKDSYDESDISLNPLNTFDENVIIFIEYNDYNYMIKVRENFKDKTYFLIVSNDVFLQDKHKFINKMIEMNHFNSQQFAWCDVSYIPTYLTKGFPEKEENINLLRRDEIKDCFLIDMAHIH